MVDCSNAKSLQLAPMQCMHVCFSGELIGQAIAIHEWEFEDGSRGGPIAEANAVDQRQTRGAPPEELVQAGQCEP